MAGVEGAEVRAGLLAPARARLRGRGRRPGLRLVRRESLFLLDDRQRVVGHSGTLGAWALEKEV